MVRLCIITFFAVLAVIGQEVRAKGPSVFQLNNRYDPASIVKKPPNGKKFLLSPIDKKVVDVIVTPVAIESKKPDRYKKNSLNFKKYPIFGRRAQPRVSFEREKLGVPRSVKHPRLDFLSRIFNTEDSAIKRFD